MQKNGHKKQIWFRRKWYGWGWYPATWQGWAITIGYIGMLLLLGLTIDETASSRELIVMFVLPFVLLTVSLIRICYRYGEKPRWQWGRPHSNKHE